MTPQHPRFARAYARAVQHMDERGVGGHRRELLAGLQGSVIEVGAGEGSSFAYYPDTVRSVLAVEPDDYLRGIASRKARTAPVPVHVLPGTAEGIPAAEHSADAVVVSLVLCSVPQQAAALAEIRRVLRPGGTLAFYEHVRSSRRFVATVEDFVSPAWQRMAGGCHPNRDTLGAIVEAGFTVVDYRRFSFAPARLAPAFDHILGHAIGPGKAS
ncbi:class I SAM-dependent methyltransferase [Arthrobacter silvisoli]|uniref:class I SAM-dependent methyltransferase n=1 Tax=Arthrobacter silvisoli TaxID=2291022 RepID=UPI001FE43C59|nr:class I SAM-dependent methyltransferase [Arthrobacter silvisoli]